MEVKYNHRDKAAPSWHVLFFSQRQMGTFADTGAAIQCPVCQDSIWPCQNIKLSFCHPIQHALHWDCWWDLTEDQKYRCSLCRQPEIPRPTAFHIYNYFPNRDMELNFEDLCGEPALAWFNTTGQGLIHDFVRGNISKEELLQITRAAPKRPTASFEQV